MSDEHDHIHLITEEDWEEGHGTCIICKKEIDCHDGERFKYAEA